MNPWNIDGNPGTERWNRRLTQQKENERHERKQKKQQKCFSCFWFGLFTSEHLVCGVLAEMFLKPRLPFTNITELWTVFTDEAEGSL